MVGVDGREDLTTYTEVDPNGRYTVTRHKVDMAALTRNEAASVYTDKGAGNIATFEHQGDFIVTADADLADAVFWGVSNVVDDAQDWSDNSDQALHASYSFAAALRFVTFRNNENADEETKSLIVVGTRYWWTADRQSDTVGRFRIYTDIDRTVLWDTMTFTIAAGRAYRYLYAANSFAAAGAQAVTMSSENLEVIS
jgi:hypothetical protein